MIPFCATNRSLRLLLQHAIKTTISAQKVDKFTSDHDPAKKGTGYFETNIGKSMVSLPDSSN